MKHVQLISKNLKQINHLYTKALSKELSAPPRLAAIGEAATGSALSHGSEWEWESVAIDPASA